MMLKVVLQGALLVEGKPVRIEFECEAPDPNTATSKAVSVEATFPGHKPFMLFLYKTHDDVSRASATIKVGDQDVVYIGNWSHID